MTNEPCSTRFVETYGVRGHKMTTERPEFGRLPPITARRQGLKPAFGSSVITPQGGSIWNADGSRNDWVGNEWLPVTSPHPSPAPVTPPNDSLASIEILDDVPFIEVLEPHWTYHPEPIPPMTFTTGTTTAFAANPDEFILVTDGDCHWYVIPAARADHWDHWVESQTEDEPETCIEPDYAHAVGGSPSLIHFTGWRST